MEQQEEYRQRHNARPSVLRARCWELLARRPEATARGPRLVAPSDVRVRPWPVGKPAVVRVDARNGVASPRRVARPGDVAVNKNALDGVQRSIVPHDGVRVAVKLERCFLEARFVERLICRAKAVPAQDTRRQDKARAACEGKAKAVPGQGTRRQDKTRAACEGERMYAHSRCDSRCELHLRFPFGGSIARASEMEDTQPRKTTKNKRKRKRTTNEYEHKTGNSTVQSERDK
jgi:hypothetical protein